MKKRVYSLFFVLVLSLGIGGWIGSYDPGDLGVGDVNPINVQDPGDLGIG